jgi:hypothetical protein
MNSAIAFFMMDPPSKEAMMADPARPE